MQRTRLLITLTTIVFLLLIPLIAMQFTDQVNWSPFDFMVIGTLLLSAGLGGELVRWKVKKFGYRIIFATLILGVFLLVWIEIAVGLFGTPFAGS